MRRPAEGIYVFFDQPVVTEAITRLNRAFPIRGKRFQLHDQKRLLVERLVLQALAYIDVLAPRFRAMINYCDAEELGQADYLESLIRVKFKKNLHFPRRDDDDDDDDNDGPADATPRDPVLVSSA